MKALTLSPKEAVSSHTFQSTELGTIPSDWVLARLGDVCTVYGRIGFRGYTVRDIVPEGTGAISLSPSNIQNGRLDLARCTYLSWSKWKESPEIQVTIGDTLLVKTGSTVGKTAFVDRLPVAATVNPQIVVFRNRKISDRFLGYVAGHEILQSQLVASTVGGALPTLSQKKIAEFRFPCPPTRVEQEAIAQTLSDVDALIEHLDNLIAKKKMIKLGAIQELLTGRTRLPGFEGEWEEKRLSDIGEITGAGIDKKVRPGELRVRLLNYMDVYRLDRISSDNLWHNVTAKDAQARRCTIRAGDVFFTPSSEMREDIGHSAVAIEDIPDGVYSYHLVRFRPHIPFGIGL